MMVGDLCAVLLQVDYFTLDGTTVIGVFSEYAVFYLFYVQSNCKLCLQYCLFILHVIQL